jgi:hypothetical protein
MEGVPFISIIWLLRNKKLRRSPRETVIKFVTARDLSIIFFFNFVSENEMKDIAEYSKRGRQKRIDQRLVYLVNHFVT